jgi:hypothetical protein
MSMDGVLVSRVIVVGEGDASEGSVFRSATSEGMLPSKVEMVRQQEHFKDKNTGSDHRANAHRRYPFHVTFLISCRLLCSRVSRACHMASTAGDTKIQTLPSECTAP